MPYLREFSPRRRQLETERIAALKKVTLSEILLDGSYLLKFESEYSVSELIRRLLHEWFFKIDEKIFPRYANVALFRYRLDFKRSSEELSEEIGIQENLLFSEFASRFLNANYEIDWGKIFKFINNHQEINQPG